MLKAGNSFELIQKSLFRFQYVHGSVEESVFESLILPILLYRAEC